MVFLGNRSGFCYEKQLQREAPVEAAATVVCVCTCLILTGGVVMVTTGTDIWLGRQRLRSWGSQCLVHSLFQHVLGAVDDGLGMLVPNWTPPPIPPWGPLVRAWGHRTPVWATPVAAVGME